MGGVPIGTGAGFGQSLNKLMALLTAPLPSVECNKCARPSYPSQHLQTDPLCHGMPPQSSDIASHPRSEQSEGCLGHAVELRKCNCCSETVRHILTYAMDCLPSSDTLCSRICTVRCTQCRWVPNERRSNATHAIRLDLCIRPARRAPGTCRFIRPESTAHICTAHHC